MTSRQIITIALSAAGLVCAALIALLVIGELRAPPTEQAPRLESPAAPTTASEVPVREAEPEPEPELAPAPPKLEPPGAEPQPPRPAQPTIWGDSPPSPAVAPSYGAGE